MEQLLSGILQYLGYFNILTTDWTRLDSSQKVSEISFACFFADNVNYELFGKLLEDFLPCLQIFCTFGSAIVIYYGQYGKLFKGPEDKSMVDVDKIIRDLAEDNTLEEDDTSEDDANEAANSNSENERS